MLLRDFFFFRDFNDLSTFATELSQDYDYGNFITLFLGDFQFMVVEKPDFVPNSVLFVVANFLYVALDYSCFDFYANYFYSSFIISFIIYGLRNFFS